MALVVVGYALVAGPVSSILRVQHDPVFVTFPFLYRIGAHVVAGDPMTTEQFNIIKTIEPDGKWNYNLCIADPLIFSDGLNTAWLKNHSAVPMRLAFELAMQNPVIDVEHSLRTGEYIWKVASACDLFTVQYQNQGGSNWLQPQRRIEYGVPQISKIPEALAWFQPLVAYKAYNLLNLIIWSPALYLYLSLFCVGIAAMRRKDSSLLWIIIPVLVQSVFLLLTTLASQFRYQYGVYLVGLWSLGLSLIPKVHSGKEIKEIFPKKS